ncbi:L,D-transpeptidase [Corynebacterium sp. H127]|uniref:L,D-transpeptidase n=1 Tax=Corynebacterium sp. H127 TaxID=3133418 RepID=UPI0030B60B74
MSKHRKPSVFKRRAGIAASTAVAASAILVQPAFAAPALPAVNIPGSSDMQSGSSDAAAEAAWNARNAVYNSTAGLPPAQRDALRKAADDNLRVHFPGLLESKLPQPAPAPAPEPAPAPAPAPAPEAPQIDRGSCPPQARACLDKAGNRAWLQHGGEVTYGPVPVSHGAQGYDTPNGTFSVTRKVKDEISYEFNNAPMPNAVYFTNNGIAFHSGRIDWLSHGCVHLRHEDSAAFFNDLQVGDMVYVY